MVMAFYDVTKLAFHRACLFVSPEGADLHEVVRFRMRTSLVFSCLLACAWVIPTTSREIIIELHSIENFAVGNHEYETEEEPYERVRRDAWDEATWDDVDQNYHAKKKKTECKGFKCFWKKAKIVLLVIAIIALVIMALCCVYCWFGTCYCCCKGPKNIVQKAAVDYAPGVRKDSKGKLYHSAVTEEEKEVYQEAAQEHAESFLPLP